MDALLKREIAAAGIKESLYQQFRDFPIKVLKTSMPVPNFVFSASPALAPDVERSFIEALRKIQPLTNPDDRRTVQEWTGGQAGGPVLDASCNTQSCYLIIASAESLSTMTLTKDLISPSFIPDISVSERAAHMSLSLFRS